MENGLSIHSRNMALKLYLCHVTVTLSKVLSCFLEWEWQYRLRLFWGINKVVCIMHLVWCFLHGRCCQQRANIKWDLMPISHSVFLCGHGSSFRAEWFEYPDSGVQLFLLFLDFFLARWFSTWFEHKDVCKCVPRRVSRHFPRIAVVLTRWYVLW